MPAKLIEQSHLAEKIGAQNLLPNVEAALERARAIHEGFDGLGEESAREHEYLPV
jgi:hypothetical protein